MLCLKAAFKLKQIVKTHEGQQRSNCHALYFYNSILSVRNTELYLTNTTLSSTPILLKKDSYDIYFKRVMFNSTTLISCLVFACITSVTNLNRQWLFNHIYLFILLQKNYHPFQVQFDRSVLLISIHLTVYKDSTRRSHNDLKRVTDTHVKKHLNKISPFLN